MNSPSALQVLEHLDARGLDRIQMHDLAKHYACDVTYFIRPKFQKQMLAVGLRWTYEASAYWIKFTSTPSIS